MGQDKDDLKTDKDGYEYSDNDVKVFAEKCDTEKILENLPAVKKQVARHYLNNTRYVRQTVKQVIERDLKPKEHYTLRLLCFDMAIDQVAHKIKQSTGIPEEDLKEMAQTLDRKELIQLMEQTLTTIENEGKN